MASGNAQLNFAIRAINEASKTLKTVEADIEGLSKSADKSGGLLGKMGGALADVGKIAGGFVLSQGLLKLPGLLTGMAKAAADDEAATMRMDTALANLAKTTGSAASIQASWTKATETAIAVGQRKGFTDDQIRDSLQQLIAATGDYDESTRRQALALDLARGANIDLGMASKLLGKITDENVQVFKKMGITLADGATEADALAAVQAKFGGQAETYARSTAGQFEASKIAMAEAREEIGYYLLPVMAKLGTVFATEVLPRLSTFIEYIGTHIVPKVKEVVEIFETKLVPAFVAHVMPHVAEFIELMKEVGEELHHVAESIIATLMPNLSLLGSWFAEHTEVLIAFAAAWATYSAVITATHAIHMALHQGQLLITASTKAWAVAQAILNGTMAVNPAVVVAVALAALVAVAILVVKHWDEINAVLQKFGGPVVSFVVEKITAFADFARDKFEGFKGVVVDVMQTVGGWFDAVGRTVERFAGWVNQHLGTIIFIFGGPFLYAIVKWRDEIGAAVMWVVDKIGDFAEMMRGPLTSVVKAVAGFVVDYFTTMKDGIVFAVEGIVAIIKWQLDWYRDMWNSTAGLRDLVVSAFDWMRDRVVDNVTAMLWPIQTFIELAKSALQWAGRIGGFIGGVASRVVGELDSGIRAEGGPVNAGGMYLVGERGPELFSPRSSGSIIPNNMLGGNGGGITIHYHQNGPVYGMLDLRSQVLSFVRDGIRGGGLRGVV